MHLLRRLLVLLLVPLLGACTHIERTQVSPAKDPAAFREVFVARNLSDNHRLAERIATVLRARGLRAESGPLTLAPASAEAILHYEDRWAWDFGEHMIYLRLDLHDPGAVRPHTSAHRLRHVGNSTDVDAAISAVVAELLKPAPSTR